MATEESRRGLTTVSPMPFSKSSSSEEDKLSASVTVSGKKVTVKSADMKESTQKEAVECAITAFEMHGVEKDIAEYIKKEFDKNHGPTWHCIVGRNFESQNIDRVE